MTYLFWEIDFSQEVLNSLLSDLGGLDIILKSELCSRKVSFMSDTGCAYFSPSARMERSNNHVAH